MALIAELTEMPPPYNDDADETWQPITLVLAGLSIYTESDDATLLYQLDRGVASLTQATHKVELERVSAQSRRPPACQLSSLGHGTYTI
ncbi:hypothetical protein BKA67DRAFT_574035 [Truncatella angustata]|uniref:Uncharacterized protein n=1 Tax=Truncatella angustata TaxID=152316 RepID=A0A9P8UHW3_9PEZI|nr:uncharacterized protein BKA67DRAFT_574035 [Truncatella angustata]KAH6652446.1 hypothetical protein BKA67DRAFT_574035 [Truncatella angustata]